MRKTITRWGRRSRILVACLALVVGSVVATAPTIPARADTPASEEKKQPSVDSADVYLGAATRFQKPAEVDANAVYAEIPEYKRIIEDDVEPGSTRYELLMNKASKRFKAALRKVAKSAGYDLVARVGAVKNAGSVPDVTQDVISQL